MRTKSILIVILILTVTLCANAQQPKLEFPLSCSIGTNCWVINYVDNDRSSNWKDYRGERNTYDGHKGTDIAIQDLNAMQAGVDVLAAANGTVVATRDSMPDINFLAQKENALTLTKVGCGNRVAIKHSDGWLTDYCHMKKESITVKKGDYVKAGQKIGEIGLSGLTEFPHLHMAVIYNKQFFDPFTGCEMYKDNCGANPLWSGSALQKMQYNPHVLYNIGISDKAPSWISMRSSTSNNISSKSSALILWLDAFHVEVGDIFDMTVTAPDKTQFVHKTITIDKPNAKKYMYIGKKRPQIGFKKGAYTASVKFKWPSTNIHDVKKIEFSLY